PSLAPRHERTPPTGEDMLRHRDQGLGPARGPRLVGRILLLFGGRLVAADGFDRFHDDLPFFRRKDRYQPQHAILFDPRPQAAFGPLILRVFETDHAPQRPADPRQL